MKLKVKRVQGDGSCMYRAVAQSYYADRYGRLATKKEENAMVTSLRNMVADYIEQHPMIVSGTEMYLVNPVLHSLSPANVARNYANNVRSRGKWGEELELSVLAHIFGRTIHVYNENGKEFLHQVGSINGTNYRNGGEPLRIAYENDLHYNALIPSAQTPSCRSSCENAKICNPTTGRCVKRDGKIGRRVLDSTLNPCVSTCANGKICNPATRRCVNRDGKIGQNILHRAKISV